MNCQKKLLIAKIIIFYLLGYAFFLNWLTGEGIGKYSYSLISVIILILIVKFNYVRKIPLTGWLVMFINVLVISFNLMEFGLQEYTLNSLIFWTYGNIIIILFFNVVNFINREDLRKFIQGYLFYIFNIYFLINVPIIILQLNHTYFMMRFTDKNPMYADHITGLIGASGTHILSLFWLSLILINLSKVKTKKDWALILITLAEISFMLIISSYNDNTAFIVILVIAIVQYFFKEIKKHNIRELLKPILIIISILVILIIAKGYNNRLNNFYKNRVQVKIDQYLGYKGYNPEERAALFDYALEYGNGYTTGKGIGSIKNYSDPNLPIHFGMSSISSKTYEGGLIYLMSIIIVYAYFTNKLFFKPNKVSAFLLALNYGILSIYTTIFSDYRLIFFLCIIVLAFSYNYSEDK